jgi:ribosomal protein S12 methylthiotransferase accessory factor
MSSSLQVPVLGSGLLADVLARNLHAPPEADLVVEVGRLDRVAMREEHWRERSSGPLLFVGLWRSSVYVGPLWGRRSPGCPRCLALRTADSPFGPQWSDRRVAAPWPVDPARAFGPGILRLIAHLVQDVIDEAAEAIVGESPSSGGRPASGAASVLAVDARSGCVTARTLLPDSMCTVCGTLSGDPASVPRESAQPLPKLAPATLRTRAFAPGWMEVRYLGQDLGLFKELRQDLQSPFGASSVELPLHLGRREPAIGRASSYAASATTAILEGLERYAGLHRGGRPAAVRAAFAEIAAHAVDPRSFGLHPHESYSTDGFLYRPYSPETVVDWVWAYSFVRQAPVLVPERAAFWGPRGDGEVAFFYDTSNGCALGSSIEEAVLHGIRELAERDSYLLTWYRRLILPEISLAETADARVRDQLRKCQLFTGYRYRAFLSTMEHGMPSLFVVAEGRGTAHPSVLAGSGAHPDPRQALAGALYELTGTILSTTQTFAQRRPAALKMLDDPALVRTMADHCLHNSLPEARERFSFVLDNGRPTMDLDEVPSTVRTDSTDLRDDLAVAIDGIARAEMDVLVVDQTMPELKRSGLSCVKVLVPGMLPMTFGHRNRRTEHLPRLTDDGRLPYDSAAPLAEPVGALPHPFP